MSITVPRAEIHAVAERYDNAWSLPEDPPVTVVRHIAADMRANADHEDTETGRLALLGEALALDALCDRVENQRDAHCVAYSHDPDTGLCECGHSGDDHDGELGQCEAPLNTKVSA